MVLLIQPSCFKYCPEYNNTTRNIVNIKLITCWDTTKVLVDFFPNRSKIENVGFFLPITYNLLLTLNNQRDKHAFDLKCYLNRNLRCFIHTLTKLI